MKVLVINIDELKPAEYNPRKNLKPGDPEYEKLTRSIERWGLADPLIVRYPEMRIIGGHQRYKVLLAKNVKELNMITLGDIAWVFSNEDIKIRSDADEKALNVALNKITGDWDIDLLFPLLEEIKLSDVDFELTGFTIEDLSLMGKKEVQEDDFDAQAAAENIKKPVTKTGDVWILGKHRLMCGDSAKLGDIERLLGNRTIKLCFTSPPYNMAGDLYENYTDNLKSEEYIKFNLKVIKIIKLRLRGFIFWNVSYNKNARWEFIEIMYRIIKETGLKFLELIVWDKGHGMPITSKGMLTRQYEDVLLIGDPAAVQQDLEMFCVASTEKRAWFNKKTQKGITNYWRIGTNKTQISNHSACYPVALPGKGIQLMTLQGDVVYDPFGGSGTTLIACEQLDRICCTMELDPVYVDVCVQRWERFTGRKAKREAHGTKRAS